MMEPATVKPRPFSSSSSSNHSLEKSIYSKCQITKTVSLPITAIGRNIKQTLEMAIARLIEGKCIVEGLVKPKSTGIITFTCGSVKADQVLYQCVVTCEICFPVAGMNLNGVVKEVNKAGIRAEMADTEHYSPINLYILRDHYYSNGYFNSIQVHDKIVARVITQRFELNDKRITVIAELVPPMSMAMPRGDKRKVHKPLPLIEE